MERQPISREGYEKIRAEIRRLEEVELPKIAENIARARDEGDLSENAEYHGQREAMALLQAKINQLKAKLASCEIVDKSTLPSDTVRFGTRVTVRDLDTGEEETYELVGPGEEDYSSEVMKILTSSPIGQGLLGHKLGDQVEIDIPRGKLRLKIVRIENE